MSHDGSEGVSPDGWLPDRVSVGALMKAFPPELVDRVVATTDTREVRRGVVAGAVDGVCRVGVVVVSGSSLWLWAGVGEAGGWVYHRRRAEQPLAGALDADGWVSGADGRRWRPPNISSLARARVGADPLHMLFDCVAGPTGARDAAGVFRCGLRVVSMDGSTSDVPDTRTTPSTSVARRMRPGMGVSTAPLAGGGRVGDRCADRGHRRCVHRR